MNIGFIGTGSMGTPMALNLIEHDHNLTVYNRTSHKTDPLVEAGADEVQHPAGAAQGNSIVITMVSDDSAVEEVVFGDERGEIPPEQGLLNGLEEHSIHLAMSTISPETSRTLRETHENHDQQFVAGPVFGKPDFAEEGTLSVVVAGQRDPVESCKPVYEAVGRQFFVVGQAPHKASAVKLAGNFTIASMMETLGECFALMQKAGVDRDTFLDVINESLYDSPLYKNYGSLIADGDFEPAGFKLKLGLKDMRLTENMARDYEAPMPFLSVVHDHFLEAVARGDGNIDWAGLGKLADQRAGVLNDTNPTEDGNND
ncbi:MAG: NAD(P)-dependent oxidoreductase [bacterium]